MRYTINLATRTYLDHRLINRIAFCVIALLLGMLALSVSRLLSNLGEQSRLKTEIASIQSRIGTKPSGISDADFSRQKNRILFYNEIIERKSMNWINILDLLETVTPEGVALSSFNPGKKQEVWKLEGRAKSFKNVQLYLEKLEASKNFSDVMLLSHQNIDAGEKKRGVQFTISCKVVN